MAHADSDFYLNSYLGDTLPPEAIDKWLERASDELDTLTFGRLNSYFPENTVHIIKIKKAVCAISEALYNIDIQRKAAAATQSDDGTYRGVITSVSSGRESISYSAGNVSANVYAAAAANAVEYNKLIGSIAVKYLANVPDSNGINLLYAGEVRHVQQYNNPV